MADLLVDTDVFIDHLRGHHALRSGDDSLSYSTITRSELYAGTSANEDEVGLLLSPFRELAVDRQVAAMAGRIRRTAGARTPDALIAGTALVHGLTLVTRNAAAFEGIPRLRVRAPR